MRSVVQRVRSAEVRVGGDVVGAIGPGLMVLLGVADGDGEREAAWMADKLVGLRVFDDDEGKMNHSLTDTGGALLVVSQFTLLADCRKGKRPSYVGAARPEPAAPLYERLVAAVRDLGVNVATGRFRTDMAVSLINDGPVTLVIESPRR